MRMHFVMLAEEVLVDSRSNRASSVNLIEEISSPQFPFIFPTPTIFASFEKEDGDSDEVECQVLFKIDKETMLSSPLVVEFDGAKRVRSIVDMNALIVPREGLILLEIRLGRKKLGSWEIPVERIEQVNKLNLPVGISKAANPSSPA